MTFTIDATGPNRGEIEFWNGPQGQNWVKQSDLTDFMYDPFGAKVIERAALKPGECVLDVGCGCGTTTGKLVDLVAPSGRVCALDVSVPMLEIAKIRIGAQADQVEFISADAATYDFEAESFDLIFSQFGLMFFNNPAEAFANLYRALKPGGRISFVSWRLPEMNPWLMIPYHAVKPFVPDMPIPSPDVATSPFSLARESIVQDLLGEAGFTDVTLEEFKTSTRMGKGDLDECLRFVADFSNPVATALRKCGDTKEQEILDAVRTAVAPYHNGKTLELPASSWIVSATRR